ncbi:MAG TPA: sec-independent translocase [Streptosporangiaceae bacterium]
MLERTVLDLSLPKLLVLALLALVIFGPDQLPKIASQAGRALRDLRRIADNARNDLSDQLGPEFRNFDVNDLNPRNFVRKHLIDDVMDSDHDTRGGAVVGAAGAGGAVVNGTGSGRPASATAAPVLADGESPPYDAEAT